MQSVSSTSSEPQEFRNSRLSSSEERRKQQPRGEVRASLSRLGGKRGEGGFWGAGMGFAALTGPSTPWARSRPGAEEIRWGCSAGSPDWPRLLRPPLRRLREEEAPGLTRDHRWPRHRLQAGPAGGSPAALGPWRRRAGFGAAAQDEALEPPRRSVTAPKWARAESPPPTARPPPNRKPCAGRGGPPPCSDEPAGPSDWSEGRGKAGEGGERRGEAGGCGEGRGGKRRGRRGGRGSGAASAEKLRLHNGSEAASASSRSVHVDGPKRKSLGKTEGEPAGGLPTATCAFSPAIRRRDAWGRVGVRRGPRAARESGSGGRASPEAGVRAEPATSPRTSVVAPPLPSPPFGA